MGQSQPICWSLLLGKFAPNYSSVVLWKEAPMDINAGHILGSLRTWLDAPPTLCYVYIGWSPNQPPRQVQEHGRNHGFRILIGGNSSGEWAFNYYELLRLDNKRLASETSDFVGALPLSISRGRVEINVGYILTFSDFLPWATLPLQLIWF